MKKIIAAVLLTAGTTTAFAQSDDRRKGFIGISLGVSIPVGNFANPDDNESMIGAGAGSNINLVNFGYRFSDRIGIAAKWFGGANPVKIEDAPSAEKDFDPWAYGGMLVGPMVSLPLSEKIEMDFRPMIGYSATTFPKYKGSDTEISETALAYSIGATVQFNVASRFGIHAMLDYFHTKAKVKNDDFEQNISTITPSVGLVYRFN